MRCATRCFQISEQSLLVTEDQDPQSQHPRNLQRNVVSSSDFDALLLVVELVTQKERQMGRQTATVQCDTAAITASYGGTGGCHS